MSTNHRSATEQSPLLGGETTKGSDAGRLILWLCLARGLETGAYMAIFPICPDLVARAGVPEPNIGFYVGGIEAIFAFSQAGAMLGWPLVSSRFGNKTVLLSCLTGTAIGMSLFGFATRIWHMLLIRCLLGCFAASELTVRIMVTDLSTPESAARNFAWIATAGTLFQILTPALTGLLYTGGLPIQFLDNKFVQALPPAALACNVYAILIVVSCGALARNLPGTGHVRQGQENRSSLSYWALVKASNTRRILLAFTWQFTLFLVMAALGPTFYYTSVELGGWGWGVRSIAVLNTCFATSNAFWAAFGFHRTISRIGLTGGAMIGAYATLVPPVWYILSSVLLREGRKIAFYVCLILSSWSMSWMHPTGGITNQLALNNMAPQGNIGSLNALAYSITAVAKALVPIIVGPVFAIAVDKQLAAGHLVWILDVLLAVGYILFIHGNLDLYRKSDDRVDACD